MNGSKNQFDMYCSLLKLGRRYQPQRMVNFETQLAATPVLWSTRAHLPALMAFLAFSLRGCTQKYQHIHEQFARFVGSGLVDNSHPIY